MAARHDHTCRTRTTRSELPRLPKSAHSPDRIGSRTPHPMPSRHEARATSPQRDSTSRARYASSPVILRTACGARCPTSTSSDVPTDRDRRGERNRFRRVKRRKSVVFEPWPHRKRDEPLAEKRRVPASGKLPRRRRRRRGSAKLRVVRRRRRSAEKLRHKRPPKHAGAMRNSRRRWSHRFHSATHVAGRVRGSRAPGRPEGLHYQTARQQS